jgi:alginate O-acetyltransferase complex protein AlgJ
MRRLTDRLLVAAFVAILVTPPLANLAGVDGADAEAENRTQAAFPAAPTTWASAKAFLPGLDAWFTDHFAFRSHLVRWHGMSRYFGLGMSPTPAVATAPRGWLFYVEDGGLEDFTNASLLNDEEIDLWRAAIVRAKRWCDARGIAYFFMVAPDKPVIYPERFPQTARRASRVSRLDQIYTTISDTGAGIDVRPALIAEKRKARLFQKTDTHWNARGAYTAYAAVIDALRVRVPAVPPPWPLSDFELVVEQTQAMDLAGMMGLKRVLGEENLTLVPRRPRHYVVREPAGNIVEAGEGRIVTEIPGSTLPRAVVFRDSFMSAMAPFLSEHFSRVVYLWRNDFSAEDVEREQPDVVLHEMVSRHVQWFVPSPELIPER